MKTILVHEEIDRRVIDWLTALFPTCKILASIDHAPENVMIDLIVVESRIDINPATYNQQIGQRTCVSPKAPHIFDGIIYRLINLAKSLRVPVIAIGSAAQYIGVLNGASLIQHVDNHSSFDGHKITTVTGEDFIVPSTHHQLLDPKSLNSKFEIVARANPKIGEGYLNQWDNLMKCDVDIEAFMVQDSKIKYLGLQFHPEVMEVDHPFNGYLKEFLLPELFQNVQTKQPVPAKSVKKDKPDERKGDFTKIDVNAFFEATKGSTNIWATGTTQGQPNPIGKEAYMDYQNYVSTDLDSNPLSQKFYNVPPDVSYLDDTVREVDKGMKNRINRRS